MLIEFRVANFRSFRDEQTLSLVASNRDSKLPDNTFQAGKDLKLLKAAAIYGANASGKSNLLKALAFMDQFVELSATRMNQGDKIEGVEPFRLDPETKRKPSSFKIVFACDEDTRFEYGFSATQERVHDESLVAYTSDKPARSFERQFNPLTQTTHWSFKGELEREGDLLREKTRDNGLVLSQGAQLNVPLLSKVFRWFKEKFYTYDLSQPPFALWYETAQRLEEDRSFYERLMPLFRDADLGIDGIRVEKKKTSLPKELLDLLGDRGREVFGKEQPAVLAVHRVQEATDEVFDFQQHESNGTQRFFALAGPWVGALDNGSVVVVDELECSMHPNLVRKLVEFFQSQRNNQKGAQLIFATQDATQMNLGLLRRDQLWIVEKDGKGASSCYSLYDFEKKPRNTEALQKNYLAGRYGGVPTFGPLFENLESEEK